MFSWFRYLEIYECGKKLVFIQFKCKGRLVVVQNILENVGWRMRWFYVFVGMMRGNEDDDDNDNKRFFYFLVK